MLTKTQLKAIFEEYSFRPLKRFGENYLIDGNIKDKIIDAAGVMNSDVVLEIGPGLGALTIDLAKTGAAVFAVEKDKKAYKILSDIAGIDFPNLKLFNEDILKFDFTKIVSKDKKMKVVGNLPYYITTPVIERLIESRSLISSMLIVVQKEVALRLLAKEGSKDYGSLSCFIQYYTRLKYIHTIKRTSFYPVPDVDSSLLKLEIPERPSVHVEDEALFFKIVRGSFNQRRKSVINSLSRKEVLGTSKDKLAHLLSGAGVDPSARPEDLSLAAFAKIANAVKLSS